MARALLAWGVAGVWAMGCSSTPEPEEQHVQALQELCGDGLDNDEDGAFDCDDPDCAGESLCACGDGTCDLEAGEDTTCLVDCPPGCGNATCDEGEDFVSCPADCPNTCGDGVCDPEEEGMCVADCDTTCYPSDGFFESSGIEGTCDECVRAACSCEVVDLEDAVTQQEAQDLFDVVTACFEGNCAVECTYPICDTTLPVVYDAAEAACLGMNCCAEATACEGDPVCTACFTGEGTCDTPPPTFDALVACGQANDC